VISFRPHIPLRLRAARLRVGVLLVAFVAGARRGAPDLLTLAGGGFIALGAGLIALPAGFIVGGLFLAAFGIALDLARARAADPRERTDR
jgi:hypothetical protein